MLAWTYDLWNTNVIRVERHSHIMCFAAQWYGEKQVRVVAQPDFPKAYKADPYDDLEVVRELWNLLDEADIVVAHNAKGFDNKVSAARFLAHGMKPPSPYKTVDTLTVARSKFKFPSNALAKLAEQLEFGSKTKEHHGVLWHSCVNGCEKSWAKMKRYCKQDVVLLRQLYELELPYISNHPSVVMEGEACPKCGSTRLQSRGLCTVATGTYRRFQCQECGGWARRRATDHPRPELVNA